MFAGPILANTEVVNNSRMWQIPASYTPFYCLLSICSVPPKTAQPPVILVAPALQFHDNEVHGRVWSIGENYHECRLSFAGKCDRSPLVVDLIPDLLPRYNRRLASDGLDLQKVISLNILFTAYHYQKGKKKQ